MSDKVKLIIEISEHQYEICKQALKNFGDRPITECEFAIAVGTPLDTVKEEIIDKAIKDANTGEGFIFLGRLLRIFDKIGKERNE